MKNMPMWIWYYGDFELHHHMKLSCNRTERGAVVPAFWKISDCNRAVRFRKFVDLTKAETLHVTLDGQGVVLIDGARGGALSVEIPAGKHEIIVSVCNTTGIPAMFAEGETIRSDETWEADSVMTVQGGEYKPVGYWNLYDSTQTPTNFTPPETPIPATLVYKKDNVCLYDFGKETFVKLVLSGLSFGDHLTIFYGESLEEAQSDQHCVIRTTLTVTQNTHILPPRACRYVRIVGGTAGNVSGLYVNVPKTFVGDFRCDVGVINDVYKVAQYTYDLTSQIFFLDGIKRDCWVWGGDAYQSCFFDYYSCFDTDIIKRTLVALRGRDPIACHINGILDYSFFWIIAIGIYYQYTGDLQFVRENYEQMTSLMDYCLESLTEDGLIAGDEKIWTFVDWSPMDKDGALCIMQMLCLKALDTILSFSDLLEKDAKSYKTLHISLREKIDTLYWNEEKGGYVTTYKNGKAVDEITRHANIFAIIFNLADEKKRAKIIKNVLNNPQIPAITTPYFALYELEAYCLAGDFGPVTDKVKSYWGGMLSQGATSFWEEFDPAQTGVEKYAMYGEPFDKSLCHAWGSGPLYLMGRYYLGVYPTKPGFSEFVVSPNTGGLEYIQGTVPVNGGAVKVYMDKQKIQVSADVAGGTLVWGEQEVEIVPHQVVTLHI